MVLLDYTLLHCRRYQSDEFLLRAQAGIPANEILAAATVNCAELFVKQVRSAAAATFAYWQAMLLSLHGTMASVTTTLASPECLTYWHDLHVHVGLGRPSLGALPCVAASTGSAEGVERGCS